jgi:hypothetical protein
MIKVIIINNLSVSAEVRLPWDCETRFVPLSHPGLSANGTANLLRVRCLATESHENCRHGPRTSV